MIERLLEADRLLALGLDEKAERIYWQAAEVDPRNAIAIVGLARVASERGDDRTALQFAHKALEIDAENPAAIRLAARLEEIIRYREDRDATRTAPVSPESPAVTPIVSEPAAPAPIVPEPAAAAPIVSEPAAPADDPVQPQPGLLRRILGGR